MALPALGGAPPPRGAAACVCIEEQHMSMTRSLGDSYAHRHGVCCEPEIVEVSVGASVGASGGGGLLLLLASDGLWDLMGPAECAAVLWRTAASGAEGLAAGVGGGVTGTSRAANESAPTRQLAARAEELCEVARAKGAEWFEEAADNLTGARGCALSIRVVCFSADHHTADQGTHETQPLCYCVQCRLTISHLPPHSQEYW